MGRRTGLAVFPPYVAEVSESPQLALKVALGKLIKGAQGSIVKPCVIIIRAAEPIEPPILGVLCHGAYDDKAQSGKMWVPSSCGGLVCASTIWSLLDCWTLGSAAREPRRSKTPPVSVANYWEPEHLDLVGQIFSRRERNRIDRLHEVVVLGWLVRGRSR